jgi:hypothetical protein
VLAYVSRDTPKADRSNRRRLEQVPELPPLDHSMILAVSVSAGSEKKTPALIIIMCWGQNQVRIVHG